MFTQELAVLSRTWVRPLPFVTFVTVRVTLPGPARIRAKCGAVNVRRGIKLFGRSLPVGGRKNQPARETARFSQCVTEVEVLGYAAVNERNNLWNPRFGVDHTIRINLDRLLDYHDGASSCVLVLRHPTNPATVLLYSAPRRKPGRLSVASATHQNSGSRA